uniref:Uncharacterized protein n=1 Tax=Ananas comosus var. bracteatus TaxID=296719 RepID=A0A6V7PWZ5_ANACO|nr:unnamed protein product [Ananas comosus var. bracteatus]
MQRSGNDQMMIPGSSFNSCACLFHPYCCHFLAPIEEGGTRQGSLGPTPIRAAAQWAVSHEIERYGGVCRGTVPCRHCFVLGDIARVPYKVLIPIGRIKDATPSKNVNNPDQKYIEIATVDDFEFWSMGVASYERSFMYILSNITH